MRNRSLTFGAIFLMIPVLFIGCSKGPSEEETKQKALADQLASIEQAYQELTTGRQEVKAAQASVTELEAVAAPDDDQKAELEALPAKIEELTASREAAYDSLQDQLANFLNTALNEFPESPETARALEIYSKEAILTAEDIVGKSGDYRKAGDQLMSVKSYYEGVELEPNPELLAEIERLDDWRFITQERFDTVTNGMTQDEVKAAIGVPYYQNIQIDDERGVETWLYKKREGGAAAIYFKTKTGTVYGKKFDAIKTKVVE
jgi:hypothetical protein